MVVNGTRCSIICNFVILKLRTILISISVDTLPSDHIFYPSYRQNQRNFWLEYSTPPSTTFAEYPDEWLTSTTPSPRPLFLEGQRRNHSVVRMPVGSTVFLDCRIKQLMDSEVRLHIYQLWFSHIYGLPYMSLIRYLSWYWPKCSSFTIYLRNFADYYSIFISLFIWITTLLPTFGLLSNYHHHAIL